MVNCLRILSELYSFGKRICELGECESSQTVKLDESSLGNKRRGGLNLGSPVFMILGLGAQISSLDLRCSKSTIVANCVKEVYLNKSGSRKEPKRK